MDVRQLLLLRELAERGSLTAVALALHVSPSAVSQQLAALQRTVATPLTEKRGRRLALTPAGHALAEAAVDVAAALDRAERAVGEHLESRTVPVRVCAFHSAALAWFGPLLSAVGETGGPPVHLADHDVAQEDFPRLVADHDLVIAHRPETGPPWPRRSLHTTHLLLEPMHVALAAGDPLARLRVLRVADVAGRRWISVHDGFPLTGALDAVAVAARHPLDVAHHLNEFAVAADVVATGDAVALLPARTTRPDPRLVLRPLADLDVRRSIDVLARPEALARRGVAEVLALLRGLATP
ncbi:LysR family transcriptional regulator [Kineococcus rubinsiae]|uniref:LysR family transcriptional regulator n=1 Tax=Kineococcus rubinsiae TaxID=2609562 RepID=UPI001430BC47|nr:LysR family transcriptional regulator [Kineococcus rubinsiae]NIZ91519.1 LysR family transcriptional regulator [Kineococcus rubinsiae]